MIVMIVMRICSLRCFLNYKVLLAKLISTIRLVEYGSIEHAGRAATHHNALLFLAVERLSIAARANDCLLVIIF